MDSSQPSGDQNISAENGGMVFNQQSGVQFNQVSNFGPGAVSEMDTESCYRYGRLKISSGEFADGQHYLLVAAESGHVGAMWDLYMYYLASRQTSQARAMMFLAAQSGHVLACHHAASSLMHLRPNEAIDWWKKAHELGDGNAAKYLAEFHLERGRLGRTPYLEGSTVDKTEELTEAIYWYEKFLKSVNSEALQYVTQRNELSEARKLLSREEKKAEKRQDRLERKSKDKRWL
ncbi:hypothetical protein [Actinacidiphila glaucinigra]|uniref:hypothetical protein n=1 Tax=Actinacidiphila glaucinigra TaxID=235986 RepID=UPI0036EFF4B8